MVIKETHGINKIKLNCSLYLIYSFFKKKKKKVVAGFCNFLLTRQPMIQPLGLKQITLPVFSACELKFQANVLNLSPPVSPSSSGRLIGLDNFPGSVLLLAGRLIRLCTVNTWWKYFRH